MPARRWWGCWSRLSRWPSWLWPRYGVASPTATAAGPPSSPDCCSPAAPMSSLPSPDRCWVLLLSRLVQGLGGGTIGVVQAYVADASPPEERTKSLGWLSAVTSLGAVAGPAFGSAMISIGGRAAPGLAAAALALLVAGFAARFLVESRQLADRRVPRRPPPQPAPEGDRPGPLPLARAGLAAHLDLHHWHRGLLRHHPGRAAPAHEPAGRHRAEHRLLRHVPGRHGRGGPLTAAGAGRGLAGGGAALPTGPRPAGGGPRLHRPRLTRRPLPPRLHPDAARHGLSLPVCHRAPVTRGAGQRARALHGGPAHLRRRIAGAVPGRRGPH